MISNSSNSLPDDTSIQAVTTRNRQSQYDNYWPVANRGRYVMVENSPVARTCIRLFFFFFGRTKQCDRDMKEVYWTYTCSFSVFSLSPRTFLFRMTSFNIDLFGTFPLNETSKRKVLPALFRSRSARKLFWWYLSVHDTTTICFVLSSRQLLVGFAVSLELYNFGTLHRWLCFSTICEFFLLYSWISHFLY